MTHFRSVSQLSSALSGGKAPAWWWRDIMQKTAKLVAVRRGGGWIEEFGDIHPRLCAYPLLGYTLASLTGQTEPRQEVPPETTRSRKAQWQSSVQANRNVATAGKPIIPQPRTATPMQSAVIKQKEVSAQALFQLKAHADRSLLSRLAGDELPFNSTPSVQTDALSAQGKRSKTLFPSDYGDVTNQQDWLNRLAQRVIQKQPNILNNTHTLQEQGAMPLNGMRASSQLLKQAFSPLDYGDSATQQDWLHRLAQRAGKAGIQKQPDTIEKVRITQNNTQILQEQWAIPLNGICASMDLLSRFVQDNFSGKESDDSAGQHQPQSAVSQPFLKSAGGYGEPLSGGHTLKTSTPPMTTRVGFPELNINQQLAYGEGKVTSSAPTIPPNVTVSLPELLTPQQSGVQPLPMAAATVRQGAGEEGMKATDDLDTLASKINQILNEQARRHGIDV